MIPELVVTGAIVQAVWAAGPDPVYACTSKGTLWSSPRLEVCK